jgi:membrane protein involved in colicin uptake|tara:strand:- start:2414 stop:2677 length:264 start_codon:yes stop_codon:yes gene_type:complete
MCLGGGGGGGGSPVVTEAQNKAAAQARLDSEAAARQQAKKVADAKREDIDEALDTASSAESRGKSGKGRRSLFSSSSGGSGYLSRFG